MHAKINNFTKRKIRREGPRYEYEVSNDGYNPKDTFIVDVDLKHVWPSFLGTYHLLMIFQSKGIAQIPDHFILQRWTKDANKGIEFSDT